MKVLVTGSRRWADKKKLFATLELIDARHGIELLIVGDARGADQNARYWARRVGHVPLQVFHADWEKHGKRAGILRNLDMLAEEPDAVLAFKVKNIEARGTDHCSQEAEQRGIKVVTIWTDRPPLPASGLVTRYAAH
jgi:hypothetical protein